MRVVGIGASAGGLAALTELIADLQVDSGLAFVLLQHRALSQPSLLSTVLGKATKMPVVDIRSGQRVEPNQIYVVPPGVEASLLRGALCLRLQKDAASRRLPIDGMFRSLANALGSSAIAVVLSGTATDGTEGLRAVRNAGGVTIAQDPDTAEYDGMPRSAIAAGVTDYVLAPQEIARELGLLAMRPPSGRARVASAHGADKGIEKVLALLRDNTGVDFSQYKRATIERRLARRMSEQKMKSIDQYAAHLESHPSAANVLYEDLLIHVTEFFRDAAALDALVARVFGDMIADKPPGQPIRVWVPGCSTGQEVYSLAMLLLEFLGARAPGRPLQIFGTDLSERAIETARAGRYPASIATEVGEARLERFFTRSEGGWRINKEVRDPCVFVRHDLLADPPFSKIDLLSCRNVLIYFGPALQRNVVPLFHYALNQPGFLLLGRSESIGGSGAFFSSIDSQHQIYARRPTMGRPGLTFPAGRSASRAPHQRFNEPVRAHIDVQRKVDHILLARYAPACVLVDADLEIQQFRGRTGGYLEPAPGRAQLNLLKMAREGLLPDLRLAIQRAQRDDVPVRRENIAFSDGRSQRRIHIEVVPVQGTDAKERYFLVLFVESGALAAPAPSGRKRGEPAPPPGQPTRDQAANLRQELAASREYLQSLMNQHAAASEELALANEELLSGNEELQSTNEELATAKEEMESTNEELATVNDELRRRNQDLTLLNDDLVNLLAAVDIALIIVDGKRQVRRFTPKARTIMSLIPADVGRAIGDLKLNVDVADLDQAIAAVIESLTVSETEVNSPSGGVYRMQIRPYRTSDDKIGGAVVSFVEITTLKHHLEEARSARDYAAAIVEAVPDPLVIVDDDLRVRSGNPAFFAMIAQGTRSSQGRSLLDLGGERWSTTNGPLARALAERSLFDDLEIDNEQLDDDRRVLLISARPLPAQLPPAIDGSLGPLRLIGIRDITAQRRAEAERVRLDAIAQEALAVQAAAREREALLDAVSHELRTPLNSVLIWTHLLREAAAGDAYALRGIDGIERSIHAETRLIDDLLDLSLSRFSGEPLRVHAESFDARPLVEASVESQRADAATKGVTLDTRFGAEAVRVWADPSRLQQIASRLIANAVKFTGRGGRVTVSLAPSQDQAELRVQDQGQGIRPEFLPHLFEPFTQEDRSITRLKGGLGIGLALVRHLVERQGGTIAAESPGEGQGATFTVRLPAAAPGASG